MPFPRATRRTSSCLVGTPRAVSNGNTVLWRWEGDAFGNSAPNETVAGWLSPLTLPLRLPGQYYDEETGLHYNYFRDYNPATGRYVESDPVGVLGGVNTYAYVRGNPIIHMDAFGLWSPGGHDALIQHALEGFLPQSDIDAIKQYGRDFDQSHQGAADSYMHSMREHGQSVDDAISARDDFICKKLKAARNEKSHDAALRDFAEAIHPEMDRLSPEHQDESGNPKEWNPWWPFGHSPNEHIGNETAKDITSQIYNESDAALRRDYNSAFRTK